jgi:PRTRC genetic system protein B
MKPKKALIIYGSGDYIEICDIKDHKILDGKPLSIKALAGITELIKTTDDIKLRGLIPSNLLYFSIKPLKLIWASDMRIQPLYFKEGLKIPNGKAAIPPLLYLVENGNLNMFSFKEFKGLETELYFSPFHNTGSNGYVCMGNAKRRKNNKYIEDEIKSWEESFWHSEFSEVHGSPLGKKNLNLFWKEMVETESKVFPLGMLQKAKKTIKNLL